MFPIDRCRCDKDGYLLHFPHLQEQRHDDPFDRNITYRQTDARFCVIDFEFATILEEEQLTETPS